MYETPQLFQHQENGGTWVYEDNGLLNFLHRKCRKLKNRDWATVVGLHIRAVNGNQFCELESPKKDYRANVVHFFQVKICFLSS